MGLSHSTKRTKEEVGVARRKASGEKMILIPASVLGDGGSKKLLVTKKRVLTSSKWSVFI